MPPSAADTNRAVYEKLIDVMNSKSLSLPAVKCEEYFDFVEELFTPEEAAIAILMPPGFSTIDTIAGKFVDTTITGLAAKLETMGDRCLVQIKEAGGEKLYELLPFIPGITELLFMGGLADERSKRVHLLMERYIAALRKMADQSKQQTAGLREPKRKVAVKQDVSFKSTVVPLAEISGFLMRADYIAAGKCICRYQSVLKNEPCQEPLDNCLIVGESAKFAVQRGLANVISREEAIRKMEEADVAGLIHHYTNSPDHYANLLCNCCQCHCSIMRGIKNSPVPGNIVIARYKIEVSEDNCTGCGSCVERCQMEALKIAGEKLIYNAVRCLGCGLCTSACPSGSLALKPLESSKVPLK